MPTSPDDFPVPTPALLARSPELAALALLERVLEITRCALIAGNPSLTACPEGERGGLPWELQAKAAVPVLDRADQLHRAVIHYRRLLAELDAIEADHGFPF